MNFVKIVTLLFVGCDVFSSLFDLSGFDFLPQNEEEVLFVGRMYEPKRGEGKDGDTLGRL